MNDTMEFRHWRFVIIALFGLVTCAVLLLVLTEFHEEIADFWLTTLDQAIMKAVHMWTIPGVTRAMFVLSFIGSWKFVAPASRRSCCFCSSGMLATQRLSSPWRWADRRR